jgi:hypothetical protein
MKRFSDALAIQEGACNPIAIANSIVAAIKEIREAPGHTGTAQITGDPAVRLMVHQLAFICNVSSLENAEAGPDDYTMTVGACRERAKPTQKADPYVSGDDVALDPETAAQYRADRIADDKP